MQLIVDFFKTIIVDFTDRIDVADLKDYLSKKITDGRLEVGSIGITKDGKYLSDDFSFSSSGVLVHAVVKGGLLGGKGGFGAMLRAQAKQSGGKKTVDFGACRDLSGRRLRHVNDEIILAKWRETKARGEEFNTDEITDSGIDLWYLQTPSWSEGFGGKANFRKRYILPRRKTQLCLDWQRANTGKRKAPEGAPAWWGCPRGYRCEFAHGEAELRGHGLETATKAKEAMEKSEEEKKRETYMAAVTTIERELNDEERMAEKIREGLRAAKRAKTAEMEEKARLEREIAAIEREEMGAGGGTVDDLLLDGYHSSAVPLPVASAALNASEMKQSSDSSEVAAEADASSSSGEVSVTDAGRQLLSDRCGWLRVVSGTAEVTDVGEVEGTGHEAFSTVGIDFCRIGIFNPGAWYYEVELLTDGLMQIGWASSKFSGFSSARAKKTVITTADGNLEVAEDGIGDDENSWAFDGARLKKWNLADQEYGARWKPGDVLGCLLKISSPPSNASISFVLSGVDLGEAFSFTVPNESGGDAVSYFPALSLDDGQTAIVNIGQLPFRHFPASAQEPVRPVIEAVGEEPLLLKLLSEDEGTDAGKSTMANRKGNKSDKRQEVSTASFPEVELESPEMTLSLLEGLGLQHLKAELERRGLKAGGSLQERANRLFSVRGKSPDEIDPKLKVKK